MPLAPVGAKDGDNGLSIQLYYEDSGAPPNALLYTTLVLLHGTGFHAAIFHRLVPFASAAGVRLVLVNRRDYPGSTPLLEDDISLIAHGSPQEDNDKFLLARALELGRFLAWFVREGDVPHINDYGSEKRKGGLSLVAWSSANTVSMALLGNLARLPDDLRDALEPYMRSHIHYGACAASATGQTTCANIPVRKAYAFIDGHGYTLGFAESQHFAIIHPLMDASLSEAEKFAGFKHWVSAYYDHPGIASRALSGLTEDLATEPPPTTDRMTPEEDAAVSSYSALYSDKFVRTLSPNVLLRNRNRALFNSDSDSEPVVSLDMWPKVAVKMLQCEKSLWCMISAMWEMEDIYQASLAEKRPVRQMEFHLLEGANHFAHWDDPEKTIKRLAEIA